MEQLFYIDQDKCQLCHACVRACPVNAIEIKGSSDVAEINANRCIGCGSCLNACSQNAVKYRDGKQAVRALLKSDKMTVAIVAPSISGEFDDITDYRKFVRMIRELGFDRVNEVSFGADLVANSYLELFDNFKGKYYITTNCPVVTNYVQKYQTDLLTNLAPVVSPMLATAKIVRTHYSEDINVVYIGPCVASKAEAETYAAFAKIDSVLTFTELRELFEEFNITESAVEYSEFDEPFGGKGSLFPIRHGLLQSVDIKEDLLNGTVISTEGRDNFLESLNEFQNNMNALKRHLDLFYCDGCIMGPGTTPGGKKFIRRSLVIDYAKKRLANFDRASWEKNVDEYLDFDFNREYRADDQKMPMPSEERIAEILKIIGRDKPENRMGCGACGYKSCRDFAIAVAQGVAKTDMCHTFAMENRQEYIKTLRATNVKLAQMQEALKKSEQTAREEQQAAQEASRMTNAMLKKLPSGVVIVNDELKIIQSNDSFVEMLGEDSKEINEVIPGLAGADLKSLLPYNVYNLFSFVMGNNEEILGRDVHIGEQLLNISVFTIKEKHIIGAVFRDLYSPEVRKEEVVARITDVIDKNLEMVQKMGFLLGESAAENERMLNSIIESYKSKK